MNKKKCALRIALCILLIAAAIFAMWRWSPQARIDRAARAALSQLGKPYVFGEAGPDSFDCSGLMKYAYARVADDTRYKTISDPAKLRRGDLVFFDTVSGGSKTDHVGFWLGDGRFVHASSAKGEVIVSDFDERWQRRFSWAKRVL